MDRLTVGWGNGTYDTFDPIDIAYDGYSKANYEKLLNKLGEYEDLEEQGLLLRLPCKVGDYLYSIEPRFYNYELHEGIQRGICRRCELGKDRNGVRFTIWASMDVGNKNTLHAYNSLSLGKTVFLTKAEAEAALDKMKGEEHE